MFPRSCDIQGRGWLYLGRGGGTFVGVFYFGVDMFLLLCRMWDYVYLYRYHSFVFFVYLNYICGIVCVFSGWPFFSMCSISNVWWIVPCALSGIYFGRILSSVCLFSWPGYALCNGL
jgi:hypothetical protein